VWYALTTDGWRSDAKQHYRTVTMHFFVPGTWMLVVVVLETSVCGGKEVDIAVFLQRVVRAYELVLPKMVAVTTDNANAEIAGVRAAGFYRIACGCHLLALSMKLVTSEAKLSKNRNASPVVVICVFGRGKICDGPRVFGSIVEGMFSRFLLSSRRACTVERSAVW
jgi:hypothetical protein